jgi:sterol desaturase/sphingolipid hydroxylase (fatty acid hydroxylase superfamily)
MYAYEMVFVSFITFNLIILFSNEIKNKKWWNGYFSCCINYLISSYLGFLINIPTKKHFCIQDTIIFVPYILLSDVVFYSMHWMAHTPIIYKKIHKQHHLWNEPESVAFLDANPVEHIFVNIPTVIVPLYFIPVSNYQQLLWIVFTTANSVISHMKIYDSNSPHIKHHKYRKVNYGVGFYLTDRILGTYY